MSGKDSTGIMLNIEGRIRISYEEGEGDLSDESGDDDDDLWLDYTGDGGRVRSKKTKVKEVTINDANGRKYKCIGRFPLLEPYWTVSTKIKGSWVYSSPAYSIKQDAGLKDWHVTLFIDDCLKALHVKERDPVKGCLDNFCRKNLRSEALSFFNLESMLVNFKKSEEKECSFVKYADSNFIGKWHPDNHGKLIEKCIFKSGLGATALRAVSHPKLVTCVSKLLPYSFQDFLSKVDPSRLDLAQDMAVSTTWEFGFRQILYNKLKMSGVEAQLSTYDKAGYLVKTPEKEKDALYIYEVLKVDAQKDGHMYMPFRKMFEYYYFKKLNYRITKLQRWKNALNYLEENKVIVREEFNQDTNIFLFHNWKAEIDTVNGLETVLSRYLPERDDMDAELSSPDFDTIRTDPDQLKASQLITSLPVVVLSGMGGCGKTTVVTNLLKHICDRKEKNLLQALTDEEGLSHRLENTDMQDENALPVCDKPEPNLCRTGPPHSQKLHSVSKSDLIAGNQNSNSSSGKNTVTRSSEDESDGGSENSSQVESKEGKLRRELKEDLVKILKETKNTDSEAMRTFKQQILLVAPTGKAARLLGCKARLPSATIHSVVMSWRMWKEKRQEEDEEEKEWMYSTVKILVVDECSLLSVRLFAAILSILIKEANLSKIVLLGDIKQLPSIEPGDFLRSVFKTFAKPCFGFSIELTQNHRSESKLIVENARRISSNRLPIFDPEQRFAFIELDEETDDNERDQAIRGLLDVNQDLQCHFQSQFVSFRNAHCSAINELCCKYYNRHSLLTTTQKGRRTKDIFHFEPGDKICLGKNHRVGNNGQILEEYVREARLMLDNTHPQHCAKEIESQTDRMNRTGSGLSAAEVTSLFAGDESDLDRTVSELRDREVKASDRRKERQARAVLQQKKWKEKHKAGQISVKGNDDDKKSSNSSNEEKLCNGEVFFIMDEKTTFSKDNKAEKYFILSDRDPILPRVVCVLERTLRKDCKMKHSWVRTIHTYQGSESATVVYFLGPAIPQNWQHVYTAVTRGKKSVYIVGKMSQLSVAVTRRAISRNSRLCERLYDMLINQSETKERLKIQQSATTVERSQSSLNLSVNSSFENGEDVSVMSSILEPSSSNHLDYDTSTQAMSYMNKMTTNEGSGPNTGTKSFSKHSKDISGNTKSVLSQNTPLKQEPRLSTYQTNNVRTPKKTPPRHPCPTDFQSPPKQQRLTDSAIDTPFRDSFTHTLSLESNHDEEEDGENPFASTSSLNKVKRKLV